MTYEQDFFQIKIVDWQIVYACHICDEGFDHIQELKEHIEISHKDIVHLFSAKEADSNVVHESEEDLGQKYSDNNEVCVDNSGMGQRYEIKPFVRYWQAV